MDRHAPFFRCRLDCQINNLPHRVIRREHLTFLDGCSCIRGDSNPVEKKITQIYSSKILPLERCKSDKKLPLP
ncbi:DUF4087 domain-containing protein [Citrobacter amalonaticus]|uniref:DUF4087 domain-containing protein n=1 Tax=Citrobacter amalonaticus TaxID=35703 RepID=UPI003B632D4D